MPRPSPYTDKQKAAILEAVRSGSLRFSLTDGRSGGYPRLHARGFDCDKNCNSITSIATAPGN